jgi:cyanophycinase-like exopeptidase
VSGTIALHGGGEFRAGDEPFLHAILDAAPRPSGPVRVAIVPTAAARGAPDVAGAHGVAAFERVAGGAGIPVQAEVVRVLGPKSAADAALAERLAAADLIHLPGGDPDLIPWVMAGSAAWTAIRAAVAAGAVLAGASAGAMGLAAWTWTAAGGVTGLGIVPGPPLLVMPHADATSWRRSVARFGRDVPDGIGILGLCERTGVLIALDADAPWLVAGEGEVRWSPPGGDTSAPLVFRSGDAFHPGLG